MVDLLLLLFELLIAVFLGFLIIIVAVFMLTGLIALIKGSVNWLRS